MALSRDFLCESGDTACLKAAIAVANDNGQSDRIVLQPGTFVLTEPDPDGGRFGPSGLPVVTSEIAIDGNGAIIERSSRDGTPDFRILLIDEGGDLTLDNVILRNGNTRGESPAQDCAGIAQRASSQLRIMSSTISGNRAEFIGGGLCLGGLAVIRDTTISDNVAVDGGGIFVDRDGELDLVDSVVAGNKADYGGGLFVDNGGIARIDAGIVTANEARSWGGGIGTFDFGPDNDFGTSLTLSKVSLTDNFAGDGGGLYSSTGVGRLTESIISGNTATFGGSAVTNRRAELKLSGNCVVGNTPSSVTGLAVANAPGAPEADARRNWWGAADGPGGVGPGSGDAVGENIRFVPFLEAPPSPCAALSVAIDVQPWSESNLVDPASPGLLTVALFSENGFDALQADLASVRLSPGDAGSGNYRVYDVNRDRIPDLLMYFRLRDLRIGCGETPLELTGQTHSGQEFAGTDTVSNRRCP